MRTNRLLATLLAAALAVVVWWPLSRQDQRPATPDSAAAPTPDYYLRDFVLSHSDESGRWDYQIQAARMQHFPDTDSWTLDAPTMTLYTERGAPWYGRSEHGRIWAGGDEAMLTGEVALWREATPENQALTIDTREVYLKPAEQYAETEAPVLVQQAERGQLRGVGARVYLDEERYELLSRVSGHYVPAPYVPAP